jgi:AP-1 complex subunit beta-1
MILQQMELITSTDVVRNLCKKMAPPLVTLLSAEPEIQYVALRNINLIVQRRPTILAHEIKVFDLNFIVNLSLSYKQTRSPDYGPLLF